MIEPTGTNGHDRDGGSVGAVAPTADVPPPPGAGADGPAPARLLALRLHGFKSFAERTVVEFGAGISAVVGPNGSGKSNLADGLRWALGEQGRALRSRKSEDVIFAGSERRAALGMADVTLVLDNADALLPVDYSVVELGRRLYRSGENDYLLNRQRIRLRDLVDLLDGAHLADNAFLFIGQGMVDQALALRPEERRPLFEEVAGVRRHERRRRRAEDQLEESEANLARVEDILAELRPQARRLAAQAQQQASRETAAEELAAALVAAAHGRWFEAAARVREASSARDRARADADHAMAALQAAEEAAATIAAGLSERSAEELERRARHDAARDALTALRLREARVSGELEAIARDRARADDERAAAEADIAAHRRRLAEPAPERDVDLEAAVSEADRALAEALAELATLRTASKARGEELAALRRAEAARHAETETARRRLAEAERRAREERLAADAADARRGELDDRLRVAREALAEAASAEAAAVAARGDARAAVEAREAEASAAADRTASAASALAGLRGRLDALSAEIQAEEARGIARAARRRGGVRVDDELVADATLRPAVEAALAEAARGYVVRADVVAELAAERGVLVVDEPERPARDDADVRRFRERVVSAGGGFLVDALRRDPNGAGRRLLARAAWLPDLASCLALRPSLPTGWIGVVRDGSAVVGEATVLLGRAGTPLERRDDATRLAAEVSRAEAALADAAAGSEVAAEAAGTARRVLDAARADESRTTAARRAAEEAERAAARDLETVARESAWHAAQLARADTELARLRDAVAALAGLPAPDAPLATGDSGVAGQPESAALDAWEARVAELRARRDRLAADLADHDGRRREAEARRAGAQAAIAIGDERIARAERERAQLADRERTERQAVERLGTELAAAIEAEAQARATLDAVRRADAADRSRLGDAEREASAARDRLRAADERLRATDHADLEARLGLDALREQLLVELAGLGALGLRILGAPVADESPSSRDERSGSGDTFDDSARLDDPGAGEESSDGRGLERALEAAAADWSAAPPTAEPPSPGRLAFLRRRYHELGAANPFAVEEYEEIRARLESLETQERDLRHAIARTRELIDELNLMIADQFRTTFRALEIAFDARFRQLFGGGFARLTLTDPGDLSATGVEIVARPPGKKAQALAMLSGGERALTAVALLFAMLEVRPVPFCVLDEVDAALDEANVGRFSEALRGLATQTQFIVITHNRGTIEAADALYGVTVGDDSVSRVISLRLDEARAIADERRSSRLADAPAG